MADFSGCSRCFDFDIVRNPIASFIRQAYVNYALAVSYAFNTTGTLGIINFAADVNRYLEDGCSDDEWLAAKQFTQQLYASLKELYPPREQGGVGLFASFSLETMLGVPAGQPCQATDWTRATAPGSLVACARDGFAALAGVPYDLFAFSAYPALITAARAAGPPSWYLTTALNALPPAERMALMVASTGFPSVDLAVNFANSSDYNPPLQCGVVLSSTVDKAAAWFNAVVDALAAPGFHGILVNFRAARDTLFDAAMDCPCTYPLPALKQFCDVLVAYRNYCRLNSGGAVGPAVCELAIKLSGALGVRDLFGQPRTELFNALQAARSLP